VSIRQLRQQLDDVEYERHPDVKRFMALQRAIEDVIPADPHHPDYRLTGALAKFRRTKGRGLPRRYRLFWAFSEPARTIIVLYLNDESTPRRAGDRRDPYAIFTSLLDAGSIGKDFEANLRAWRRRQSP
jgi:toxin YhaV